MIEKKKRVIMARLSRRGEDEEAFDIEFWNRVSPEVRFAIACAMNFETAALRGQNDGQPGLKRTVQNIIRRES